MSTVRLLDLRPKLLDSVSVIARALKMTTPLPKVFFSLVYMTSTKSLIALLIINNYVYINLPKFF